MGWGGEGSSQKVAAARGPPGGGPSRAEWRVGWFLPEDASEGGGNDDAQDHTADDDHDLLLHREARRGLSAEVEPGGRLSLWAEL